MDAKRFLSHPIKLVLLAASLTLIGCNDDDALRDHDDHDHAESSGRLAFGRDDGANQLIVFDLEARNSTAIDLSNPPTAVYASPGMRYAVVPQAGAGQVNFVDGGVWLHDDHLHADDPSLLALTRFGTKPAHFQRHEDQAAMFYDGDATEAAKFELLTDASLETNTVVAAASLPVAVHGIAEPRDGFVLVSDYSAEEAALSAPRSAVKLYELHGDHFHDEGRFATPCLNLHGGASNEDHTAFGCSDGVLLIRQEGSTFTDQKVVVPVRISQVAGHHEVPYFVAFAGSADNDALYIVDPDTATATAFDWKAGATVTRRQHTFDTHGEHLLILDNTGTLHVFEAAATGLEAKGSAEIYTGDQPAARIATSASADHAYVTDPAGRAIAVVDLEAVEVIDHVDLDFAPVGIAWLGVAEEAHDH